LDKSGCVQIQVIDSGAGLSQEQLKKLFRQGVQFNVNILQAGQGSGLGLYISKGIVEQHGGSLEVSSEGLNHGSTFTITLPLYHVPDTALQPPLTVKAPVIDEACASREKEVDFHPLRILVVDDVATNRKLLKRLAVNRGHNADEARDGREAVDMVEAAIKENKPYDSILMDFEMPVLRGPEATKKIREMGCDWFVVGVTGNVLSEDVAYFTACGANHVLPKPVDFNKLEELWDEHGISGQMQEPGDV